MMNAIVIEDEVNVREAFMKSLKAFCPEIKVLGYADSVASGKILIDHTDFDVLFLDINLPDGTGFNLLEQVENKDYSLVFVTAYDEHAIKAFKLSAVDYLLKPVSPDLLVAAVDKVKRVAEADDQVRLDVAKTHLNSQFEQSNKIILRDQESLYIRLIKDIVYCHAEGSYTRFRFAEGPEILTSTNLKEYELLLSPFKFTRNHHSYLCNLYHVAEIKKTEGGSLVMSDGSILPISARKKAGILEKLKELFIG
jgi:two-component system LytT family response regulator